MPKRMRRGLTAKQQREQAWPNWEELYCYRCGEQFKILPTDREGVEYTVDTEAGSVFLHASCTNPECANIVTQRYPAEVRPARKRPLREAPEVL